MLGFFVTFVVSRWLAILNGIGWIDNSAMAFATFIHGEDENTKLLRRTLIRYMVLNQALVLRDISMQVRKRFPTLETLIAAGLLTSAECKLIESINDHYSRYWVPLQWCHQHLCKARADSKIPNDNLLGRTLQEIHTFQQGLATLLKFDWVPVPLIYPQLIFMSVRIYFILCLISRQFLKDSSPKNSFSLQWCHQHLCKARADSKIPNDNLLGRTLQEIHTFQQGLATLLKFDWVPVPLIYPQLIFMSVRIYFILCLISRQFLKDSSFDIWIPITTMIQFVVYMGWMKVAEMLLNPLGDDDDDLECNYVIDKNLITGLTLVERGSFPPPEMEKDVFWNETQIAPLYTKKTAKRYVSPLIGSAASVNILNGARTIQMMPHQNVLNTLNDSEKRQCIRIVEIVPPLSRTAITVAPENQGQMFKQKDEEKIPLNNFK
uniref:Bestrophin homolog n=2 Tax=Panagrolaimus TaxID=55784 RepID=A0A914PCH7_9BILA